MTRARRSMPARFGIDASEKIAVADIMAVTGDGAASAGGLSQRPAAGVRAGAERLRPSLHLLHHPYGRGNSRSVPMGAVVDQVRALVERGHAEIVLTGVDLTSYGADLPGAPKLGALTKQILRHVPELKRLRISSIDSIEVDRDLLDVIADDERLMPHLHLSLQSGDDLILKRMKRRHSRPDAIEFCAQVRRLRPDIALGADIIAGFPTETEEMFARSQDLVDECDLTFLHVFPYSKRPGTPAARMPQVAGDIIRIAPNACARRARRLCSGGSIGSSGQQRSVLIESADPGPHRTFHSRRHQRRDAGRGADLDNQRKRRRAIDGVSGPELAQFSLVGGATERTCQNFSIRWAFSRLILANCALALANSCGAIDPVE